MQSIDIVFSRSLKDEL